MSIDAGTTAVRSTAHHAARGAVLPDEGRLPPLDQATQWLNSSPLSAELLRGRVVLIDFWTYTCVNWLRTLPYLRAWHTKYSDAGLTIIGVHTPEFAFEADSRNVAAEVLRLGIRYPVALDPDYGVWEAFANAYWPALYLADPDGHIRHHHAGEGEYERTEMLVQQLLPDDAHTLFDRDPVSVRPQGLEVAADWASLRSPETYLGYGRGVGADLNDPRLYDSPHVFGGARSLPVTSWSLSGAWRIASHAAVLEEAGGRIAIAFHARDLNLVMGPALRGRSIPFRVTLNGAAPEAAHGADVDGRGVGVADGRTTYQLIRQQDPIGDAVAEITFGRSGLEAYCMTFG